MNETETKEFIGQKIKEARKESGLSQAALAKIMDVSRTNIAQLEGGQINVSSLQLVKLCGLLKKPISYFFPAELQPEVNKLEGKLIDLFRELPEHGQKRILRTIETQRKLYQRVRPYEEAGVPEEFYDVLLWEQGEILEMEEALEGEGELIDFVEFYKKFAAWLDEAEKRIKAKQ